MNLSIFTAFFKNKNIIFKIRRSKVTDYAALISAITLKKYVKTQRFNFTYRLYGKRSGEDPTKITITNASIDKQITLKRDYIYKIENTDLEIGVSGVLLHILIYFEAR